jgi:hypothetical protein
MNLSVEVKNNIQKLNDFLFYDIPPCTLRLKSRYIIDVFKAGMPFICIAAMFLFSNYSPQAALYTGLHGSYGLLWLLKDLIFPDPNFDRPSTIPSCLVVFAVLVSYASFPFVLMAK